MQLRRQEMSCLVTTKWANTQDIACEVQKTKSQIKRASVQTTEQDTYKIA